MPLFGSPDMAPLDSKVVYPSVGYCIYCFTHKGELTNEHALPAGLGGRHIIPEASCTACQKIINEEFETYCMRTLLGLARQKLGIKSDKKRPKPKTSILVMRKGTKKEERVRLPPAELPLIIALPAFPPPFALHGLMPPKQLIGGQWIPYLPSTSFLESVDAESVLTEKIAIRLLARQLAKIAHCLSFARFGFDIFEPWLPDVILGRTGVFSDLVGGSLTQLPEDEGRNIFFGIRPFTRHDGVSLLVCDIRLFSSLGGPLYTVVAGRIRQGEKWNPFNPGQ